MQTYGCLYEKGLRRSNQDSIALHKIITAYGEAVLAVVCDGIGGLKEGETASGYVAEKMSCWFYEELPGLLERRSGQKCIGRSICRKLFHLHTELKAYGKKKGIFVGTTVSILLVLEKRYLICHVGDSVIYRLRKESGPFAKAGLCSCIRRYRGIRRMTRIHGDAVSRLERCIGTGKYDLPDLIYGRLKKSTGFLLASDGFYHMLKEEEIFESFCKTAPQNTERIEKRLRALAERVMQRGGTDNISAIYLE